MLYVVALLKGYKLMLDSVVRVLYSISVYIYT